MRRTAVPRSPTAGGRGHPVTRVSMRSRVCSIAWRVCLPAPRTNCLPRSWRMSQRLADERAPLGGFELVPPDAPTEELPEHARAVASARRSDGSPRTR